MKSLDIFVVTISGVKTPKPHWEKLDIKDGIGTKINVGDNVILYSIENTEKILGIEDCFFIRRDVGDFFIVDSIDGEMITLNTGNAVHRLDIKVCDKD